MRFAMWVFCDMRLRNKNKNIEFTQLRLLGQNLGKFKWHIFFIEKFQSEKKINIVINETFHENGDFKFNVCGKTG